MTMNEVGACIWSRMIWKKKWEQKFGKYRWFTTYELYEHILADWSPRSDQVSKDSQNWLKCLVAIFLTKAYKRWSY